MKKFLSSLFLYSDDGRYVTFEKSGSLGIQVTGGNAVGIFIAVVHQGSAAAMAGLQKGDQILEVRLVLAFHIVSWESFAI